MSSSINPSYSFENAPEPDILVVPGGAAHEAYDNPKVVEWVRSKAEGAESVLSVRGRILPATLSDVRLQARGASGRLYEGESAVGGSGEPLHELALLPPRAPAFPPAVEAIRTADLVLLGPGSLHTSILPNLLIPGIRNAVRACRARVVLLMNLMTQPGETDEMDAVAHLEAIQRYAGRDLVDTVLVNRTPYPEGALALYAETGSHPVAVRVAELEARGVTVVERDLLADGDLIRHDPAKLSREVLGLAPAPGRAR